jgi:glycosyltransferase involved in cell wall biosynthesis
LIFASDANDPEDDCSSKVARRCQQEFGFTSRDGEKSVMPDMTESVKKLVYIVNARLPTEKAHGYQICKMCAAFARNGVEVQLWHPYRHQMSSELKGREVFDYYDLPQVFGVRTVPNFDVIRLERVFPEATFRPLFSVHAFLWGLYAALKARKEKADIYYTRDSVVAYWLLRLRLPTIYEEHVVPRRAQRAILRRVARQSELRLVVVLTSFIKKGFLEMGFSDEKVAVVPDAVDLSLFANLPSREECRRLLGLPQERSIIGYIGRFQALGAEKGIPELVQTMAHLPAIKGKEPLLLCVGGPMDPVADYIDLARRYGAPEHRLRFIDRVPNSQVPLWIRACDVVTIPWGWTEFSAYFTSPLKLFEYMAAEVPIVASDLPSLREILQHGENAWLVKPGDPYVLAAEVQHILDNQDLARKLVDRAKKDVQKHTWNHRTNLLLKRLVTCSRV